MEYFLILYIIINRFFYKIKKVNGNNFINILSYEGKKLSDIWNKDIKKSKRHSIDMRKS